jgi:hypothetical protein
MKYKIGKPCSLDKLKIPKGYRLIEDWELLRELRTDNKLQKLANDRYIWTNRY